MQEPAYERRGEQYLLINLLRRWVNHGHWCSSHWIMPHNQGIKQTIIVVPEQWNLCNISGDAEAVMAPENKAKFDTVILAS